MNMAGRKVVCMPDLSIAESLKYFDGVEGVVDAYDDVHKQIRVRPVNIVRYRENDRTPWLECNNFWLKERSVMYID